jgi:type IX secretion system PorP/SprF family membrane protein
VSILSDKNIDQWLFNWKEGNLSSSDLEQLEDFLIKNPEFTIDQDAWNEAYIQKYPQPVFQNKSALIKKKRPLYPYLAAASVLLLIGSGVGYHFSKNNSDLEFNQLNGNFWSSLTSSSQLSMADYISIHDEIDPSKTLIIENTTSSNQFEVNSLKKNTVENSTSTKDITVDATTNQWAISHATTNEIAHSSDMVNTIAMSEEFFNDLENDFFTLNNSLNDLTFTKSDLEIEENNLIEESSLVNNLNTSQNEEISDEDKANLNPDTDAVAVEQSKEANTLTYKTNKFKRFIHKFKNAMKRGTGITNLRESDLVIAGYNHLDFNPAYTGSGFNFKIQTQAYGRWLKSDASLVSMNASVDGYVHAMRSSVGLKVDYDNYGVGMYQNMNATLYFSPKINITKTITLEPGIKFTMGQRKLNENKVIAGNNIEYARNSLIQTFEKNELPNGSSAWYKDLGIGLNLNTKWFYANVAVDHLLKHQTGVFSNNSSERADVNVTASIGTNYQSYNKKWLVSPFIAYRKESKNHEMWFGSGVKYKWLTFGAGVSTRADLAANLGFKVKGFQMFYQYELLDSELMGGRLNAHQLTLRVNTTPNRTASRRVNL